MRFSCIFLFWGGVGGGIKKINFLGQQTSAGSSRMFLSIEMTVHVNFGVTYVN